jgi:hypothetical protein
VEKGRLGTISPGLLQRLRTASPEQQREIAVLAATTAIRSVELDAPAADGALMCLRARRLGPSPQRDVLASLRDELDALAWDLQDAGSSSDYPAAFQRARAASSLWYALDEDAETAALEAVYESQAAIGGLPDLAKAIDQLLL